MFILRSGTKQRVYGPTYRLQTATFLSLTNQCIFLTNLQMFLLTLYPPNFYLFFKSTNPSNKLTMKVVLLELMTQMMEQRMDSTVYLKLLIKSESVNSVVSISPSEEMGDRETKEKIFDLSVNQTQIQSAAEVKDVFFASCGLPFPY